MDANVFFNTTQLAEKVKLLFLKVFKLKTKKKIIVNFFPEGSTLA